jgi:A/G-specific adenine glycosylase
VVSEFMLQQTQVATVLPYFARWVEALPDFAALAAAPEEAVLRLWEGLGYYSRARNLHRLAKAVAAGGVPRSAAAWRELPGVGPYTAAAIASIAFGGKEACVDGNVVRILARLTREGTLFRDSASASRAFAPLACELLNPAAPGDHNQAMMELGATVCLRRNPSCPACPVRGFCGAAATGDPGAYPRLEAKRTEHRSVVRVWCEHSGSVLLHRNPAGARRLAGLHELPTAEQAGLDPARAALGKLITRKTRTITRFRIVESIHAADLPKGPMGPGLVWIRLGDLGTVSLSGPHRRWTTEVLAAAGS